MNKKVKSSIVVIVLFFLCLVLALKMCNNSITAAYSYRYGNPSYSMADAVEKDVLVSEVRVEPNEIQIGDVLIKFKECWIEQQTQIVYWFLLFNRGNKKLKTYNLCFTLKNKASDNIDTRFTFQKDGVEFGFGVSGERYVYPLDLLDSRNFKVYILKSGERIQFAKPLKEAEFSF